MRGLFGSFGIPIFALAVFAMVMAIAPVSVMGAQLSFLTPDINAPGATSGINAQWERTNYKFVNDDQRLPGRPTIGATGRAEPIGALFSRHIDCTGHKHTVHFTKANHVQERRGVPWRRYAV